MLFSGKIELLHEKAGLPFLLLSQRLMAALWIFNLARDPLWLLARLPHELYHPLGPLALLPRSLDDWVLSPGCLLAVQGVTLISLFFCLSARFFTVASLVASVGITLVCCQDRGFGSMVRQDLTALLAMYALSACSVAGRWNDWIGIKKAEAARVPVVLIPMLLCFTYFLAGTTRAIMGGSTFFMGSSSQYWITYAALSGRYYDVSLGIHFPEYPLLMACMPWVVLFATSVEISAPLCLIWAPYRLFFVPFIAFFHCLTLVTMNIFFINNIFLLFWLIDWPRYFPDRFAEKTPLPVEAELKRSKPC